MIKIVGNVQNLINSYPINDIHDRNARFIINEIKKIIYKYGFTNPHDSSWYMNMYANTVSSFQWHLDNISAFWENANLGMILVPIRYPTEIINYNLKKPYKFWQNIIDNSEYKEILANKYKEKYGLYSVKTGDIILMQGNYIHRTNPKAANSNNHGIFRFLQRNTEWSF